MDHRTLLQSYVNKQIVKKYRGYPDIDDIRQAGFLAIEEGLVKGLSESKIKDLINSMMSKESRNKTSIPLTYETKEIADNNTPERLAMKKEFWEEVKSILTEDEYDIIERIFIEGYNLKQVSYLSGCTIPFIEAARDQALKKLKENLSSDYREVL